MDAGAPGERNDPHGDRRRSLEVLDCLGMALTTVSNAWPEDGTLACIHTQREPDVSPAGNGTDYPRPKGPPHGSLGGKPSGSPSWPKQDTPIKGMAVGAIREQ